jgi:hypothetical protein
MSRSRIDDDNRIPAARLCNYTTEDRQITSNTTGYLANNNRTEDRMVKVEQRTVHAVPTTATGLTDLDLILYLIFKRLRTNGGEQVVLQWSLS